MLGSLPYPPRQWPDPPPAHTNVLGTCGYPYGLWEREDLSREPRVAHLHKPDLYHHQKVDEQVFSSGFSHRISQLQQIISSEESTKPLIKDSTDFIKEWCGTELKDGACSRTTPRCVIKSEPSTPCQVQEVTTSSKTDITGSTSSGIPVGIAIARQRVQQSTPSPLTVVCQDRNNSQVPSWPLAPPQWQFAAGGNGMDQALHVQTPQTQMGLQLVRDHMSGQLVLLPTPSLDAGIQRIVWPGSNIPPPVQVMQAPQPQPLLLDHRLVINTQQAQIQDKRRNDSLTSVMVPCDFSKSSGSMQQQPLALIHPNSVLIQQMPFTTATSHHNNSLLLSTHSIEQGLINQNIVISNHLENTVINPQIIGMDGTSFNHPTGLLHHMPPSLVISHTETNSFVRSNITPVLGENQMMVKAEIKTEREDIGLLDQVSSPQISDDKLFDEEDPKTPPIVQDASNQTETPVVSDEDSRVSDLKSENDTVKNEEQLKPENLEEEKTVPDLSGLELLSNSIFEHCEKSQTSPSAQEARSAPYGLGLLCEVAANHNLFTDFSNDETKVEKEETKQDPPALPLETKPENLTAKVEPFIPSKKVSPFILMKHKNITLAKKSHEKDSIDISKSVLVAKEKEKEKEKEKDKKKHDPHRDLKKIVPKNPLPNPPKSTTPPAEPPRLEPWSALPKQKTAMLNPPTLTPHKKRKSFDDIPKDPPVLSLPIKKKPKMLHPVTEEEPIISSTSQPDEDDLDEEKPKNKIRPKLKAETKVKTWQEIEMDEPDLLPPKLTEEPKVKPWRLPSQQPVPYKKPKLSTEKPVKNAQKGQSTEKAIELPCVSVTPSISVTSTAFIPDSLTKGLPDCKLTEEHLNNLPCSILMAMDGLFYIGKITEAKADGIYEVILERERHRKPHIYCREEIMTTSLLEARPESAPLPAKTRVCAYWSHEYSGLYPGVVCSDCGSQDEDVSVDFDDGDNGRIKRKDIRLLPANYPVIGKHYDNYASNSEYNPNPLSSLGKRRRYNSTNSSDSPGKLPEVFSPTSTSEEFVRTGSKTDEPDSSVMEKEIQEEVEESDISMDVSDAPSSNSDDKEILELPSIISTMVENFFQNEKEEKKRLKKKKKEKGRRKHKHREGCLKSHHKRKHKHHRKHKHKHCPDEKDDETKNDGDETPEPDPPKEKSKTTKTVQGVLTPITKFWEWKGPGVRRGRSGSGGAKARKIFYKEIQRGEDVIAVGDCAVFISTGRPDRPFIGQIESFWGGAKNKMCVKVSWFYHPEETIGAPDNLPQPGALFKSPHKDINDIQTISHLCRVLPLSEFEKLVKEDAEFIKNVYEEHETYYLAGYYDPQNTSIKFEKGIGP